MAKGIAGFSRKMIALAAFVVGVYGLPVTSVYADWETAVRGGYSSNVDHSIRDPQSDSYLLGAISYAKSISGDTRLNWAFDASLEGAGYFRNSDLSYGELTLSPGLIYFLRHNWSLSASPFVQGRAVVDSDQSTLTIGGKVTLREQLNPTFYLTQFYLYRDSVASSSVYSTWEHTLGAVLGVNWTKRFYTELGYEFSHGTSFRSLDDSTTLDQDGPGGGGSGRRVIRGGRARFSTTFDTVVFREVVDRHAGGITIGFCWVPSLCGTAGYTYGTTRGDSGTSRDHAASIGIAHQF